MNRMELIIHIVVAAIWISLAVVLGLKIALLGNEQSALNRQRGIDRKARIELAFQRERVQSQLTFEASPPALEEAVRRLQLPLQPPQRLAER
ncbi:MAG: hypothetical protein H0V44_06900 [Planctomycetes bacterium]|nr:hypothetical protein [Planctomycetota bacterium]